MPVKKQSGMVEAIAPSPYAKIDVIKRSVIGQIEVGAGHGDTMAVFFDIVEGNARESMNPDTVTIDQYEMSDDLGVTQITVKHTPHR